MRSRFFFTAVVWFAVSFSVRGAERFSVVPADVWQVLTEDETYCGIPGLEAHGRTEVEARVASLRAHCRSVSYQPSCGLVSLRFNGPEHALIYVVRRAGKRSRLIAKLVEAPAAFAAYLNCDQRDGVRLHVGLDSEGNLPARIDSAEPGDLGLKGGLVSDPRSEAQRAESQQKGETRLDKTSDTPDRLHHDLSTDEDTVDAPREDIATTVKTFAYRGGRFVLATTETADIAAEGVPPAVWPLLAADDVFKEMDGALKTPDISAKGGGRLAVLKEKGQISMEEFAGVRGVFYLVNYRDARNGVFFLVRGQGDHYELISFRRKGSQEPNFWAEDVHFSVKPGEALEMEATSNASGGDLTDATYRYMGGSFVWIKDTKYRVNE